MQDPTPTRPSAISKAEREALLAEFLQRVHTTAPFHADEFNNEQRTDLKDIFKEAVNEWLEDKFAQFGRWAAISILAFIFVGLLYFAAKAQGWHVEQVK